MKSILISIKPEWVEKILNGEKTIEIRKSIPKCELPCKVYIYCTKGKDYKESLYLTDDNKYDIDYYVPSDDNFVLNGKVVAEFTLNKVEEFEVWSDLWLISKQVKEELENIRENSCLSQAELLGYLGKKHGYAWHIDDLKIYDTPKELSKFSKYGFESLYGSSVCGNSSCPFYIESNCYDLPPDCIYKKDCILKRPPQSWCYVEGE